MRLGWKRALVLGGACGVCCAPWLVGLIGPTVLGGTVGGLLGGVTMETVLCGAAIAVVGGVAVVTAAAVLRSRSAPQPCGCGTECVVPAHWGRSVGEDHPLTPASCGGRGRPAPR